jgi:hypothetical protein
MFIRYLILLAVLILVACARQATRDPNSDPAVDEFGSCDIQFVNSKICADLIWERRPTETESGSFVLEFYSPQDRSQFMDPPGSLNVVLWTPSTERESSPVTIEKLAPGQYRVSKVFFIMHGDWEIQLKLRNGSNILDQTVQLIHF